MQVSISALQEIKSFQRLRPLKYIVRLVGFTFSPKGMWPVPPFNIDVTQHIPG
jgi:hypothetical protein